MGHPQRMEESNGSSSTLSVSRAEKSCQEEPASEVGKRGTLAEPLFKTSWVQRVPFQSTFLLWFTGLHHVTMMMVFLIDLFRVNSEFFIHPFLFKPPF